MMFRFGLLYLLDEDGHTAHLLAHSGSATPEFAPPVIQMADGNASPWPLANVAAERKAMLIENLSAHFDVVPSGPWDEAPDMALIMPIASSGHTRTIGFLIGGISARLALDEDYRHFYELVAGHIATAVANARAYDEERRRADALAELDRNPEQRIAVRERGHCVVLAGLEAARPKRSPPRWREREDGRALEAVDPDQRRHHCGKTSTCPQNSFETIGVAGMGRMLEPEQIAEEVEAHFQAKLLAGRRVLVTAGPTQEPIDPVRVITNSSSGKMGYSDCAGRRA
ncbi:MAG: GAF domain-containing protein, partial [Blastochloris sp.]|nr:GAF domain-containing protein [Blastochloris sp.]